ncbi:MAG: hypothetical protein WC374_06715 [Phycisphaerae bacterium]|jgi:cytoskeletal protein RodZ
MKNIKKQIKELKINASAELDERVNEKFVQALGHKKPAVIRKIMQSRLIRYAAAAGIIGAIWLITQHKEELPQPKATQPAVVSESQNPADMVSIFSLNKAFRDGGLEAVEKRLEKADEAGPKPKQCLSVDEMICELYGC